MRLSYFIVLLGIFLVGCISPPYDVNGNNITILTPKAPDYDNLKSEEQLMEQFTCHFGVDNETKTETLVIWTCNKDVFELNLPEDENPYEYGFYTVDAHPMGTWAVTYIMYNGTDYIEIIEPEQLESYFIPLKGEQEALIYTYLHEGLWIKYGTLEQAPLAGETNVKTENGDYIVTILHSSHNMCPCYGTYWKSVYRVTTDGDITKTVEEVIYEVHEDCIC